MTMPFTQIGVEIALNLVMIGGLIEAYLRPPRGWLGGPAMGLFCTFVLCLNLVLLAVNVAWWLALVMYP